MADGRRHWLWEMWQRLMLAGTGGLGLLIVFGVAACAPVTEEPEQEAEVVVDLETALSEYGVIMLHGDDEGVERGTGFADQEGFVRFYSPSHEGLWEFELQDSEEAVVSDVKVVISMDEGGASYLITDPTGEMAPMAFSSAIPTSHEELEVDAIDLIQQGGDLYAFDDSGADPFFTIVGLASSLKIRGFMQKMATVAALGVLRGWVDETCVYFAPLYDDVCDVVADVVASAGSIGIGGLKLTITQSLDWRSALAKASWTKIRNELLKDTCSEYIGAAAVSWIVPSPESTVQTRYREAAYKYQYLLHKIGDEPPEDVADYKGELGDIGKAMTHISKMARDHYYDLHNTKSDDFLAKNTFKYGSAAIKHMVKLRPIIASSVPKDGYHALLVDPDAVIEYQMFRPKYGNVPKKLGSEAYGAAAIGCALAVLEKVTFDWLDETTNKREELKIDVAVGYMIDMAENFIDEVHEDLFGEDIPEPDCLPDLWEPNGDWKAALAMPTAATLTSSSVVRLEDVNLCNGESTRDDDWYAFPAQMMNFDVEGRIRRPDGGKNTSEEVCVELYWYSELYEIGGMVPSIIEGPVCGTVDSQFSTRRLNVSQVTGVRWRFLLARVYPKFNDESVEGGIDYTLTFTP